MELNLGRTLRRKLRTVLHWKYSGVLISISYGAGITLVAASEVPLRFVLAYTFFCTGGILAVGYWLTSDWIVKQEAKLRDRQISRHADRLRTERQKLDEGRYGVTALILMLTAGLLIWAYMTNRNVVAAHLKQLRDDVFNNLKVEPVDLPIGPDGDQQVLISILDGGQTNLLQHTTQCVIRGLLTMNNVRFVHGMNIPPREISGGLLGSGRGETVACSILYMDRHSPACVGLDVNVRFAIAGQPTFMMNKQYRFSYYYKRQTPWLAESLADVNWDPCERVPDVSQSTEGTRLHARIMITPTPDNKALPEPLSEKRPLRLNYDYQNEGNESAKTYRQFHHSWICAGNPDSASVQEKVWEQFKAYMHKTGKLHLPGNDFVVGRKYWATTDPEMISRKEIALVRAGIAHIFLTVAIPFEDSEGIHTQESCMYIQAPADPESPWHECELHHSQVDVDTTRQR